MIQVTNYRRNLSLSFSDPDCIIIGANSDVEQVQVEQSNIENPISVSESEHLSASVTSVSLLDIPQTQLSELLAEVLAISDSAKLFNFLNSSAPFDKNQLREEISQEWLIEVYEMHRDNNTEDKNITENKETDLTKLIQVAS